MTHFFDLLNAFDILARSNLPFFGPLLNLIWLDLFPTYRCHFDSLRLVALAVLATALVADLAERLTRLTSPTSSRISSSVPSILTKGINLNYQRLLIVEQLQPSLSVQV